MSRQTGWAASDKGRGEIEGNEAALRDEKIGETVIETGEREEKNQS